MKTISLRKLSSTFQAYKNCIEKGNKEWESKHEDVLNEMFTLLPSGSGIDAGVKFDFENSKPEKLIFTFGYHHMNEGGYYDGWTEHSLVLTPSFAFGFNQKITGKDRNFIKEYLYQLFGELFTA